MPAVARRRFELVLIKPSHYDDDGYVIQWFRCFIPSNSLACLYGLAEDVRRRHALGPGVEIVLNVYDESHTVIPVSRIIRRIRAGSLRSADRDPSPPIRAGPRGEPKRFGRNDQARFAATTFGHDS